MSEHASPTASAGFLDKHHFLLRRLHSLSGILPVGVFVIFHLFTNAQIVIGDFQHEVEFIHNMPALLMVEIFGLWLPIAFHAGLGIVYTFTGKANVKRYKYADNWRYTLQRITGMLALVFIFVHIATLRWGWNIFGWYTPFYALGATPEGEVVGLATASTALALQHSILVALLYVIGVLSVIFHWSNGLWTAAITWGLTISVPAQKRWGQVCVGLFVVLFIFSAVALQGSLAYKLSEKEQAAFEFTDQHYDKLKRALYASKRGDQLDLESLGLKPAQTAASTRQ